MASKRTVVVGIVGSGAAARCHTRNYPRVYGLEARVKGVAARTAPGAQRFADEFDVEVAYPSLAAMLDDPQIDLVDICVPNSMHNPIAVRCARAGKHIVVEKTFTAYFGPGDPNWLANGFSRRTMLEGALHSADEMIATTRDTIVVGYDGAYLAAETGSRVDLTPWLE